VTEIIEAKDGYFVLWRTTDGGCSRHPVIAWVWDDWLIPIAVGIGAKPEWESGKFAIAIPDGRVFEPISGLDYKDQAAWLKHVNRKIEQEQAQRAEPVV